MRVLCSSWTWGVEILRAAGASSKALTGTDVSSDSATFWTLSQEAVGSSAQRMGLERGLRMFLMYTTSELEKQWFQLKGLKYTVTLSRCSSEAEVWEGTQLLRVPECYHPVPTREPLEGEVSLPKRMWSDLYFRKIGLTAEWRRFKGKRTRPSRWLGPEVIKVQTWRV